MKTFQDAQREKLMLMRRTKSSVIGFPGKIWGNKNMLSIHKAPESSAKDGRTPISAMITLTDRKIQNKLQNR
jgi:hypothetical protein